MPENDEIQKAARTIFKSPKFWSLVGTVVFGGGLMWYVNFSRVLVSFVDLPQTVKEQDHINDSLGTSISVVNDRLDSLGWFKRHQKIVNHQNDSLWKSEHKERLTIE